MNKQLTHQECERKIIKHNITLVLDNLEHLENIGSAFRLADAFCVKKIIILDDNEVFLENNARKNVRKINKTARSCMNYIEYEIMPTSLFLKRQKKEKNTLIAIEITNKSIPLQAVKFNKNDAITIMVGNENKGVSQPLLEVAHETAHILMYGNNSSLNVASALSIALYEVTNQLKE
jgi:tRNA G18 (ribose-2'-O)-methylase SpoU